MAEWIYFIHPLRDNFAATMTPEEEEVWGSTSRVCAACSTKG